MKKLFSFLTLIGLLMFCSSSFASVGIRVNGTLAGEATDLNVNCGSGGTNSAVTTDGSVFNAACGNLVSAGFSNGGASLTTSMASNVNVVPTGFAYVRRALDSDSAFQSGTLANGIPGQILTFEAAGRAQSGTISFTITPATSTGFSAIKFTVAGDTATFVYLDDNSGWILQSYEGTVTVTLKN